MPSLSRCVGAIALAAVAVHATSSGEQTSCDAWGDFGCSTWRNGDRLACTEKNHGLMEWVARPVYTDKYTLRAETIDYVPGSIINLHLEVNDLAWKYRGLLLDAVDHTNTTVGSWEVPEEGEAVFWSPPQCANAIMHVSADLKPYSVRFRFRSPVQGGTITFRALIKKGPANHGYFYYPNHQHLVMKESHSAAPSEFTVGQPGESCYEVCKQQGKYCDMPAMESLNSEESVHNAVGTTEVCPFPLLSECSAIGAFMEPDKCTFHDAECPDWRNDGEGSEELSCQAKEEGKARVCACGSSASQAGDGYLSPAPRTTTSTSPLTMAAPLLALLALSRGAFSTRAGTVMATALVLSYMVSGTEAHNWLFTPGRASTQASTSRPCRGRKTSDTHAQVGPGQHFNIKWATGHNRASYIVVVAGENYHWLGNKTFVTMVNDYLDNAPAGVPNLNVDTKYKRYHGTQRGLGAEQLKFYSTSETGVRLYKREVPADDENFLTHPTAKTTKLWEYNDAALEQDVRRSYKSEKYPWIESAGRYEHLHSLPVDFDVVSLKIDGITAGPGHYITHWRWSGYTDCMDIDVRTEEVDPEFIYGEDLEGHVYNKVDHCQYVGPKQIITPCIEVNNVTVNNCIDALAKRASSVRNSGALRYGVNVIPSKFAGAIPERLLSASPATGSGAPEDAPTDIPQGAPAVNIPFNNYTCARGDMTSLDQHEDAEISSTPVDWSKWEAITTVNEGMRCSSTVFKITTTLKEAVTRCARADCLGLAWQSTEAISTAREGRHVFWGCKAAPTATAGWTAFMKNIPEFTPDTTATGVTVNFQPADLEFTPPGGALVDVGEEYGDRGGNMKYGWHCERGMTVEDAANPDMENTYLVNVHNKCPDGVRNHWDVEVANGVYEVTTRHNRPKVTSNSNYMQGCSIENTRSSGSRTVMAKSYTHTVEVTDGKLTFGSYYNDRSRCTVINFITYKKVGTALPPAWLPSAANPWWMLSMPSSESIGVVSVGTISGEGECSSRWLFSGASCRSGVVLGEHEAADQGYVVGVSDTPCTGGTCGGTVCGKVTLAKGEYTGEQLDVASKLQTTVDCGGASGKYVYVQLKGSKRILSARVKVARAGPVNDGDEDSLVCYAVLARTQTETKPEYVTTTDPEDPIFYSTCYVREKNKRFLSDADKRPPEPRWKYHGKCLDCKDYKANFFDESPVPYVPPKWHIDDQCYDCTEEQPTN